MMEYSYQAIGMKKEIEDRDMKNLPKDYYKNNPEEAAKMREMFGRHIKFFFSVITVFTFFAFYKVLGFYPREGL